MAKRGILSIWTYTRAKKTKPTTKIVSIHKDSVYFKIREGTYMKDQGYGFLYTKSTLCKRIIKQLAVAKIKL